MKKLIISILLFASVCNAEYLFTGRGTNVTATTTAQAVPVNNADTSDHAYFVSVKNDGAVVVYVQKNADAATFDKTEAIQIATNSTWNSFVHPAMQSFHKITNIVIEAESSTAATVINFE